MSNIVAPADAVQWVIDAPVIWGQVAETGWLRDLLPAIPIDATLNDRSTVEPKNRGKVPGRRKADGTWVGFKDWNTHDTAHYEIDNWKSLGGNIGVHLRQAVAFDLDLATPENSELARVVREAIAAHAAVAAWRQRPGSLRFVMLFGLPADPARRVASKQMLEFSDGSRLELLTEGNYVVLHGLHRSGERYQWHVPDGVVDPMRDPAALPPLDRDMAEAVFATVTARALELGLRATRSGRGGRHQGNGAARPELPVGHPELLAKDMALLAEALCRIPNATRSYDDWITVLRAVKAACGGDEDFYAAHVLPWALQYAGNTPDVVRHKWDGFTTSTLGADYIESEARRHGWNGVLVDVFSAAPTATAATQDVKAGLEEAAAAAAAAAAVTATDNVVSMQDRRAKKAAASSAAAAPAAKDKPNFNDAHLARDVKLYSGIDGRFLRYARDGAWYEFGDGVWRTNADTSARVVAFVARYIESIAPHLATTQRARAVEALLRDDLAFEDEFDADPWMLNTPGGVVDLRMCAMRPHDPKTDRFRLVTKGRFRPGATCPLFRRMSLEWMSDNDELHEAFLDLLSSMVTGEPQEALLFVFKGEGRNGKSSCLHVMQDVLGDYVASVTSKSIAQNRRSGADHTADRAKMVGRYGVFVKESSGIAIDEGFVKEFTGGDLVDWRGVFMAQGEPFHGGRMVLLCNDMPKFQSMDRALTSRLRVVPFDNSFADDPSIRHRLQAEADGILTMFVERFWLTGGKVRVSGDMLVATEDEVQASSPDLQRAHVAFEITVSDDDLVFATDAVTSINNVVQEGGFPRPLADRDVKRLLVAMGARHVPSRSRTEGRGRKLPSHFRRVRLRTAKDWCT